MDNQIEAGFSSTNHEIKPHSAPRFPSSARSRLLGALKRHLSGSGIPPFDVILPDGVAEHFGGVASESRFCLQLRTSEALSALASLDEVRIGEAYMNGAIDVTGDFMVALDLRRVLSDRHPVWSVWRFVLPLLRGRINADKHYVRKHYDFGNEFYFAFLDSEWRLYSQALYRSDSDTLEQAVRNKLEYIMQACRLEPGSRVLDVGGGWGSFARFAGARGVNVTALTISHEQFKYLKELALIHGPSGRLEAVYESVFAYQSDSPYDAIVLLGVMEHLPDYPRLFAQFDRLMRPNGRLYMDFAAIRRKYNVSSFTYRHVFPGDHTPVVMPDLLEAVNSSPFETVAIHNDRHSYFRTLQAWARRLEAARPNLVARFGERTFRLFQLYLWGGAHLMQREGRLESYRVVFQKSAGGSSEGVGLDTD